MLERLEAGLEREAQATIARLAIFTLAIFTLINTTQERSPIDALFTIEPLSGHLASSGVGC